MIVPGMVSATFRQKPAEDIIRLCLEGGLNAVEWSENAHVRPGDPEGAAALGRRTREAGLAVAAYGSYFRLGQNEDPGRAFSASLESAAALGAPVLRIWAGTEASADVDGAKREALAREAALVCGMADERGIKVALEWHKNTLTDTNESAMEFLRQTAHDNLYCLWQPTVALSMEQREEGLRLLGGRLLNLHVYYWRNGVRRPLAEGTGEWERYLTRADKSRDRYALLEFVMNDAEEQFLADAKTLREILNRCAA